MKLVLWKKALRLFKILSLLVTIFLIFLISVSLFYGYKLYDTSQQTKKNILIERATATTKVFKKDIYYTQKEKSKITYSEINPTKKNDEVNGGKLAQFEKKKISHNKYVKNSKKLLDSPIKYVNFCAVSCSELNALIDRYKTILKGQDAFDEDEDPAYQLAVVNFKASWGPFGKLFFELMDDMSLISQRPVSLINYKAIVDVSKKMDQVKLVARKSREKQVLDVDELQELIESMSKQCSRSSWDHDCSIIEREVEDWVAEGSFL